MKSMSETIVFFGSGPVAATSLEFLNNNFTIEAVITKSSTEQMMKNLVECPVYTVNNKIELDTLISNIDITSPLGVVVDFGIIISEEVIKSFNRGIVNSHFSLLPQWRGADPISFSILSGQDKTGVSLMVIEPSLDTGKLITQKSLKINPRETTPSLTNRLVELSNRLLKDYLPLYVAGNIKPKNQPHPDRATYSRKLTKEDGIIDWSKPADQIEREIRAFIDWPKSRTTLASKDVIITEVKISNVNGKPGNISTLNKEIVVCCGENALVISKLKPAGKKEMTSEGFIAGHKNLFN